ncbi:response regulator [Pseudomonas sp. Gutcm_11s]|uniref:response regulator n=1 Tax=Pseudomonas sp. Gutcm_11s TaxID=3026088 RepID=UPI002362DEF4|nr:response regulator [Pseudomonas sp. Gutcm_11s]MDD0842719.1 response regulator [Pseudomonas sp. Gutcm_11s]
MQVVCVIDDELSVRKGIANLLRSAGYQPVCFESGENFLASPWRVQAACVLLDLQMLGLQGPEVLRALNGERPVISMSAHANEQQVAETLALGAIHFLAKPFTAEQLLQAIALSLAEQP